MDKKKELEISLLSSVLADARDTINAAHLKYGSALMIAQRPDPYVPPKFQLVEEAWESVLQSDVVFVRAPAAVGKSTTAAYLSFTKQIPILDLSRTPVATSSFGGSLDDAFQDGHTAVSAFHRGDLPIIIDALDEGRVFSGEASFERFLDTLGRYILERSTVSQGNARRPKVLLFGRDESIELSNVGMLLSAEGLRVGLIELLFFDRDSATELIDQSAKTTILDPEQRNTITVEQLYAKPMRALISKYFREIGSAIGLPKDRDSDPDPMWENPGARAFAGYAPVLVALGAIIARITNPYEITMSYDSSDAWDVLSGVLSEILEREGGKFRTAMGNAQAVADVPQSAYDAREQLTYLTHVIHDMDVTFSGRGDLSFSRIEDNHEYMERVKTALVDHPFVKKSLPANDVMGSAIIAHAINEDLLRSESMHGKHIKRLSRQPFLWLHIRKLIVNEEKDAKMVLLDGRYLGCLFRSYWNDPQNSSGNLINIVQGKGSRSDVVNVSVGQLAFDAISPIVIYGRLDRCVIQDVDEVHIQGEGPSLTFEFVGNTKIVCNRIRFLCRSIRVSGELYIDSSPEYVSNFSVTMSPDARVTLGDDLRRYNGWSGVSASPTAATGGLMGFIEEFQRRLEGATSIVMTEDYEITDSNMKLKWISHDQRSSCSKMMRRLVANGMAKAEPIGAANRKSFRIRFYFDWEQVKSAFRGEECADAKIRRLLDDAIHSDNFGFG